ncbi:MAG: selenoneine biosynthesis selenosugar synthase SenB, partial [Acidimicrobiia bacterium]
RCDLLLALHARRSAASVAAFADRRPGAPIILALTGTDVYGDIRTDPSAQRSLELADRYVVLQRLAADELPGHLRSRCRVIYQSATCPCRPTSPTRRPSRSFQVVVLANLRSVKDPLRTAAAVRRLPSGSAVRVIHLGGALDESEAQAARAEMAENPRYKWVGELARWKALRVLARSQLCSLTSRAEGGANVVSEAIACAVPLVSSRIPGSVGLLGTEYPGYFPVGDTDALAALIGEAERSPDFLARLEQDCVSLRQQFTPERELADWAHLLDSL